MSLQIAKGTMISTDALIRILHLVSPRALDETSTTYHIGYEKAKQEIATVIGKELGFDINSNPAHNIIKHLKGVS